MQKFFAGVKGSIALVGLVSAFIAIMIPIPGGLIDFLIVGSILVGTMVYMMAASIGDWDELSYFPSILMLTAVFRVMLNISTTRKILTDGNPGTVVETAGQFIVGSSVGIGVVMFIALIVFQFVIANGASRASEVAARFTLDSLPGKQMSIDSDLQQGLINQEQAKEKREKLDSEVDFYGAMDGAGKFVKGDVVIGIVLTVINITAGFIIGMTVHGMSLQEASFRYTLLTIGDGVVSQISSLMIAIAAAMVMTRVYSGRKEDIAKGIFKQLTTSPTVSYAAGGIFLCIGLLTPLPWLPFVIVGLAMIAIAYQRGKQMEREKKEVLGKQLMEEQQRASQASGEMEVITEVEPFTLEVGIALVPVVGTEKEGETIKDKVEIMRKNIAKETGVIIPPINVLDNASLLPYTKYNIYIKDNLVATGDLRVNSVLALKTPYTMREIEGIPTKDPVYGDDAIWITEDAIQEAKEVGYTVLDPLKILATHLNEVVRNNLHELIGRQEVKDLLDTTEKRQKILIDEINKEEIPLSIIQGVLQNLLREGVSIRDLPRILEAIIDCKTNQLVELKKIDDVTSIVRERLSKQICEKVKNPEGEVYLLFPNREIETGDMLTLRHDGYYLNFDAKEERAFLHGLVKEWKKAQMSDIAPILLTQRTDVRAALARLIHKYDIPIPVLSINELVPGMNMTHIGTVVIEEDQAV